MAVKPTVCHPERSPVGAESKDPEGASCALGVGVFLTRAPRAGFVVRKTCNVWARRAESGSFDSGAHDEAVSTFAQDDSVWAGLGHPANPYLERTETPSANSGPVAGTQR